MYCTTLNLIANSYICPNHGFKKTVLTSIKCKEKAFIIFSYWHQYLIRKNEQNIKTIWKYNDPGIASAFIRKKSLAASVPKMKKRLSLVVNS